MRSGWHAVQTVLWSLGAPMLLCLAALGRRLATLYLHPLSACIDDQYRPIFSHATVSCFRMMFVLPLAGLHQDQREALREQHICQVPAQVGGRTPQFECMT